VTDRDLWRRFVAASAAADFGLAHDATVLDRPPFGDMEWLPGTADAEDPIHGRRLSILARQLGREREFREVRLEISRLTQKALRAAPEIPEVNVEATRLEPVARGAALYAARMAASEIVVGSRVSGAP
jgi:hypothetical protein